MVKRVRTGLVYNVCHCSSGGVRAPAAGDSAHDGGAGRLCGGGRCLPFGRARLLACRLPYASCT